MRIYIKELRVTVIVADDADPEAVREKYLTRNNPKSYKSTAPAHDATAYQKKYRQDKRDDREAASPISNTNHNSNRQ